MNVPAQRVEPVTGWPFGDLQPGHYGAILADPPWRFRTWSDTNQKKAASRYYDLMTLEDINALPVGELAAGDCALFLWAVNPMIPQAIDVMASWGFKYSTVAFTWAKTTARTDWSWAPKWHMGLGYWSRANTEMCLLGTRGKPKRLAKDVRQLIIAPRREHSRKPDAVYTSIERLCGGPYLDLFSRESRPHWHSFGNEISKFNEAAE